MKKLMILCILSLILSGCAAVKKEKSTNTNQKEVTKVEATSESETTINKPIEDEIKTSVQDSGDPILDKKIDEILKKLNTSKTSGGNSYNFRYDEELRELIAEIKVAQTENKKQLDVQNSVTEKTFEERVDNYIKKIVIPWWMYLIVIFIFRKDIFAVISFIFPAIRGITSLTDFLPINPKNKNG